MFKVFPVFVFLFLPLVSLASSFVDSNGRPIESNVDSFIKSQMQSIQKRTAPQKQPMEVFRATSEHSLADIAIKVAKLNWKGEPARVKEGENIWYHALGVMFLEQGDGNLSRCSVTRVAPGVMLTAGHCLQDKRGIPITSAYCRESLRVKTLGGQISSCTEVLYASMDRNMIGQQEDIAFFRVNEESGPTLMFYERKFPRSWHKGSKKNYMVSMYADDSLKRSIQLEFVPTYCQPIGDSFVHFMPGSTTFAMKDCQSKQGSSGAAVFGDPRDKGEKKIVGVLSGGVGTGMTPEEFAKFEVDKKSFDLEKLSFAQRMQLKKLDARVVFIVDTYCVNEEDFENPWREDDPRCTRVADADDVELELKRIVEIHLRKRSQKINNLATRLRGIGPHYAKKYGVRYRVVVSTIPFGQPNAHDTVIQIRPECFLDYLHEPEHFDLMEKLRLKRYTDDRLMLSMILNEETMDLDVGIELLKSKISVSGRELTYCFIRDGLKNRTLRQNQIDHANKYWLQDWPPYTD